MCSAEYLLRGGRDSIEVSGETLWKKDSYRACSLQDELNTTFIFAGEFYWTMYSLTK